MQAILFALIAYVGWGIGDLFGALVSRKIGAYSTTFWVFVLGLLLFTFYIPVASVHLSNLTWQILALNLLLGVFFIAGNIAINEAFRLSNVSLVGTIGASFTALTVVFSLIFLKEVVTLAQAFSILIIFLGLILSGLDLSEIKKGNLIADKGIKLAFLAMVAWAIYFTFIKIPVKQIGWFWPNYISFMLFPIIYLFMRAKKIQLVSLNYKKAALPVIICTLLLRLGDFSFMVGISKGLTSIVAPIAGAYPTLFAILAFLVFRDTIKRQQMTGIIITLFGIVLLSIVSV